MHSVSRWAMLAYDDKFSIRYFRSDLRPYWARNGWQAADLLLAAAGQVRAVAPGKLCGAFYGYHIDLARAKHVWPESGHLALGRVLASPDVDFLVSPTSYLDRRLGGATPGADAGHDLLALLAEGQLQAIQRHSADRDRFGQDLELGHGAPGTLARLQHQSL